MKHTHRMLPDLNKANAIIVSAIETLTGRDLSIFSALLCVIGPLLGVSSVTDLDTLYTAWTLAGGMVGAGIAFSWRGATEPMRVVVGRAIFALVSGVGTPPLASFFYPQLENFTKNPILLACMGMVAALLGYTIGHAVVRLLQKREERIGREVLKRTIGIDIDDIESRDDK